MGEPIAITYTGLRLGEKLYEELEELFHDEEDLMPTAHEQILRARTRRAEWSQLSTGMDALAAACAEYDEPRLMALLQSLVPECSTPGRAPDNVIRLNRVSQ
ncbi:MAG TPA: hypothetical protein ENI71_02780 [Chromatiales bacterium]|nr:hypothetical protein [Chromatiales bacterium]